MRIVLAVLAGKLIFFFASQISRLLLVRFYLQTFIVCSILLLKLRLKFIVKEGRVCSLMIKNDLKKTKDSE